MEAPEPTEEELAIQGELPTEHNKKTITTPEQDQGVHDLNRFFAEARPQY